MQSQRSGVNLGGIWWLAPLSGAPWGGIWCRTRVRVIYTGSKHLFYNVSRILYRNKHKKPLKRIGSSSYYHEVRGGGGIWCKTCVQIEARRIHSKIAVSGDSHITVRTCWIYVVMYIQLIYIISLLYMEPHAFVSQSRVLLHLDCLGFSWLLFLDKQYSNYCMFLPVWGPFLTMWDQVLYRVVMDWGRGGTLNGWLITPAELHSTI